ncbi:hypothetical protein [Micromonospora sp. NPDC050695]|uniref:hypothetical protein n=1 Tax=Micromonospora sp. NPDC050695 TaxID=3154938 RepID=UPI0033F1C7F0
MTWRWEAFDPAGVRQVADVLSDPWAMTADVAADTAMAHLMVRVRPEFGRLAGWRVRAWAAGVGEAWADADEWLRTVEGVGG